MTSGLGFRIPSSQLPSPQGRPWPPHTRLATAFLPMSPGHLHSHGGQAGEQVRAQHQSHKLPITSVPQDKIPSKYSKRKSRVQVCSQEPCCPREAGTVSPRCCSLCSLVPSISLLGQIILFNHMYLFKMNFRLKYCPCCQCDCWFLPKCKESWFL